MWRSSAFETDWERKKAYLIRSLFQDVVPLSPVPEDESVELSHSHILRSPFLPPKVPSRPPSPLPPLIIEKEPNRHDEPEEFYKKLEKKVLSVYRRLFIEGRSDISSNDCSDIEGVVDMDYITYTSFEKPISPVHDDFNESCHDLDQIFEKNCNERTSLKRTISPENYETGSSKPKKSKGTEEHRSSTEASPKSSTYDDEAVTESLCSTDDDTGDNNDAETEVSDVDNNTPLTDNSESVLQVTFRADVHRDANDYEFARPPSVVYECVENIAEKVVEDIEDISDSAAILENNAVSDNSIHHESSDQTNIDEIEIMRSQQVRPSVGSLRNQENTDSHSDEIAMDEEPKQLERHTESFSSHDSDPVSMEFYIDFDLLHRRSTVERDCSIGEEDISRRFRRNSTSSSSDRSSSCSYADAEVQTSVNHEGVNSELLKDIFVGIPRVFSLCSCANHSCIR